MKNPVKISAIVVLLAPACMNRSVSNHSIASATAEFVYEYQEESARKEHRNNMSKIEKIYGSSLDEIEANLNAITKARKLIDFNSPVENKFNATQKQKIIREIQIINSLLEQNEEKIEQLKLQAKKNAAQNEALERIIRQLERKLENAYDKTHILKEELVKRDFEISDLTMRIADLESEKKSLATEFEKLYEKTHTAYVAMGTTRELKERGIIHKEGGILTIGSILRINDEFPMEEFEAVNIDENRLIPIHTRKATLITDHPKSAYEFSSDENGNALLIISDPEEFWKTSRILIVQKL